jgi:hypothetical protein
MPTPLPQKFAFLKQHRSYCRNDYQSERQVNARKRSLERLADAWSSHNVQDVQELLDLFTDDCIYEHAAISTVNAGREGPARFRGGLLRCRAGLPA